jgi:hypothetical protein
MPAKDVSAVPGAQYSGYGTFNTPAPPSQYTGYGNFNVPSTPAAPRAPQVAAYDPLTSFNTYVRPTVAALENNTAPQTGPNESTMAMNGTLTFADLAVPDPFQDTRSIPAPPDISALQPAWEAANLAATAPPGQYSMADGYQMPRDVTEQALVGMFNAQTQATNAPTYQNVAAPSPGSMPYDIRNATSFDPFGPPQPGMSRVSNIFNAGNPADLSKNLAQQITDAGTAVANSRNPAVVADNTATTVPGSYDPLVSDPLIDLPDPAPPTDRYIGPIYPGQEDILPGGGGGGNQPVLIGGGGNGGQNVVPVNGPPPAPPTPPTGGGGGGGTPPAPVNPFNQSYNNPAYQTVVQLPALTQIAPISQGMGSLLPNIVIIDPFTGQPVPR